MQCVVYIYLKNLKVYYNFYGICFAYWHLVVWMQHNTYSVQDMIHLLSKQTVLK